MDLDIKGMLNIPANKKNAVANHIEGDALVIGCIDCDYTPIPGSRECFRCMVETMASAGSTSRIVLRAGKDLEISGKSSQMIRSISSLRRNSAPVREEGRKCRNCNMSRNVVMDAVWDSFPDAGFSAARSMVDSEPGDASCERCVRSTQRALEQLERDLEDVRS